MSAWAAEIERITACANPNVLSIRKQDPKSPILSRCIGRFPPFNFGPECEEGVVRSQANLPIPLP